MDSKFVIEQNTYYIFWIVLQYKIHLSLGDLIIEIIPND